MRNPAERCYPFDLLDDNFPLSRDEVRQFVHEHPGMAGLIGLALLFFLQAGEDDQRRMVAEVKQMTREGENAIADAMRILQEVAKQVV